MVERPPDAHSRRLLAGARPTGRVDLGYYADVLLQGIKHQEECECFFLIADVQALTTHHERPAGIRAAVRDTLLDCVAAGLDPGCWHFVVQSQLPELAELTVYLQLLVTTGELTQNPTIREEARSLGRGDFDTGLNRVGFGFLGYPVFQTADVLLFSPFPFRDTGNLQVPVGADQLPHIELAREVAARFNSIYSPIFVEPQAQTSEVGRLPRLDGSARIGGSRTNTVYFGELRSEYARKIETMHTDPKRTALEQPGNPHECPCYAYHRVFSSESVLASTFQSCTSAELACDVCKRSLVDLVGSFLGSIEQRRAEYESQPHFVQDALSAGTRRARMLAQRIMAGVREAMNLTYPELAEREE
ncbi:tryptophan--tRNA ligase [Planctomycetota bacterium]